MEMSCKSMLRMKKRQKSCCNVLSTTKKKMCVWRWRRREDPRRRSPEMWRTLSSTTMLIRMRRMLTKLSLKAPPRMVPKWLEKVDLVPDYSIVFPPFATKRRHDRRRRHRRRENENPVKKMRLRHPKPNPRQSPAAGCRR